MRGDDLFSDQVKGLADELSALSRVQFEALETAGYIPMNEKEAEYDERHVRIGELCGLIGVFLALPKNRTRVVKRPAA